MRIPNLSLYLRMVEFEFETEYKFEFETENKIFHEYQPSSLVHSLGGVTYFLFRQRDVIASFSFDAYADTFRS